MKATAVRLSLPLVLIAGIVSNVAESQAASLTTTFASNNGSDGNMFDITTFANPITINSISINTDNPLLNQSLFVDLYTKTGTYLGSEQTPGAWTYLGRMTATGQGKDNPTLVNLSTPLALSATTTTGFYVDLAVNNPVAAFTPLLYTGQGTTFNPVTYSNSDLQLTLGKGLFRTFGSANGGYISTGERVWNGIIAYTVPFDFQPTSGLTILGGILGVAALRRRLKLTNKTNIATKQSSITSVQE